MGHRGPTPPPPPSSSSSSCSDTNSIDGSAGGGHAISRTWKNRYAVDGDDDDGAGDRDRIECSGKYCRSCSAAMIADCVAICCCPCAVVNLITLAFVKVPYMVARRCLKLRKKKKENKQRQRQGQSQSQGQNRNSRKNKRRSTDTSQSSISSGGSSHYNRRCALEKAEEELPAEISRYGCEVEMEEEEEEDVDDCVVSADRVWWELSQVGHLGFGRVSFTGIQVQPVPVPVQQGKANLGT